MQFQMAFTATPDPPEEHEWRDCADPDNVDFTRLDVPFGWMRWKSKDMSVESGAFHAQSLREMQERGEETLTEGRETLLAQTQKESQDESV